MINKSCVYIFLLFLCTVPFATACGVDNVHVRDIVGNENQFVDFEMMSNTTYLFHTAEACNASVTHVDLYMSACDEIVGNISVCSLESTSCNVSLLSETEFVCVRVTDRQTNVTEEHQVRVDGALPIITLMEPLTVSSNLKQEITVEMSDEHSGIDMNSLEFCVEGECYGYQDGEVNFNNDKVTYKPVAAYEDIEVTYHVSIQDNVGHSNSISGDFYIDIKEPSISMVTLSESLVQQGKDLIVKAKVKDEVSLIKEAYAVVYDDSGEMLKKEEMFALDGMYDESEELVIYTLNTEEVGSGTYYIGIEVADTRGIKNSLKEQELILFTIEEFDASVAPQLLGYTFSKEVYESSDEKVDVLIETNEHTSYVRVAGKSASKVNKTYWEATVDSAQQTGVHGVKIEYGGEYNEQMQTYIFYTVMDEKDITAPQITVVSPEHTVVGNEVLFSLETNENAVCGIGMSDSELEEMNSMTSANEGTEHESMLTLSIGQHLVYIVCADQAGNEKSKSVFVTVEGDGAYQQDLKVGWNTLWVPNTAILQDMGYTTNGTEAWSIETMLSSILNDAEIIWYNVDGTATGWQSYVPGKMNESDLMHIQHVNDKPYWVKMKQDETFVI